MKKCIAQYHAQLATLEAFAEKFGHLIPEDVASISLPDVFDTLPGCNVRTGFNGEDRARVLSLAGEVFGTSGWMKEINYDKTAYHWKRTIDGVEITIYNAEPIPVESNKQAVPPSAFPVLLKEVAA